MRQVTIWQRYMRRADAASRNWIGQLFVVAHVVLGAVFGLVVGGASSFATGRSFASGARLGFALGVALGVLVALVLVAAAWSRRVRTAQGPRG